MLECLGSTLELLFPLPSLQCMLSLSSFLRSSNEVPHPEKELRAPNSPVKTAKVAAMRFHRPAAQRRQPGRARAGAGDCRADDARFALPLGVSGFSFWGSRVRGFRMNAHSPNLSLIWTRNRSLLQGQNPPNLIQNIRYHEYCGREASDMIHNRASIPEQVQAQSPKGL